MRRLLCLFGLHQRSRGRAHQEQRGLVSVCRHCGKAMIKDRRGRWHSGLVARPTVTCGPTDGSVSIPVR